MKKRIAASALVTITGLLLTLWVVLLSPPKTVPTLVVSLPDETRNIRPLKPATTTTTTTVAPAIKTHEKSPSTTSPQVYAQAPEGNWCSLVNNFDWPKDVAYRVCIQESGGDTNNANWNDYHSFANCYGSFGLMQINCGAKINHYDPHENMAQAYSMWKARGWQPWINTCKKVGC